ncbi:hypothetical protein KL949_004546 [Ogataea haglerorum]|nr:hypothetical protein KL913_004491 [Ogataea haglerorum]KAG7715153.1 hypothetical protein KL949_004546 [Ogataea haglerorum]
MEENKRNTLNNLNTKIPDIKKTLDMCRFLKNRKEHDEETVDVNYELNDTVYSTAEINVKELDSVSLWLGADIMMEYPIDEAIEMLEKRLQGALDNKAVTMEDLEYLRSNITTMEVNTARVVRTGVSSLSSDESGESSSSAPSALFTMSRMRLSSGRCWLLEASLVYTSSTTLNLELRPGRSPLKKSDPMKYPKRLGITELMRPSLKASCRATSDVRKSFVNTSLKSSFDSRSLSRPPKFSSNLYSTGVNFQ